MADKNRLVVHVAAFSSVPDAEQALATIEQLYKDDNCSRSNACRPGSCSSSRR